MTFDKTAYQREYMARQRAEKPTSRVGILKAAVTEILALVGDKPGPVASSVRKIGAEALDKVERKA